MQQRSMPHIQKGYEIVKDVKLSDFCRQKIAATTKELLDEREVIKNMLVK